MRLVCGCGTGSAFSPACSQQRHSFVETTLRAASAARVADLGCGDCALMVHLAESTTAESSGCGRPSPLHPPDNGGAAGSTSFTDLIGVDISLTALVRGRKRLEVTAHPSPSTFRTAVPSRQLTHIRGSYRLLYLADYYGASSYHPANPSPHILLIVALHVLLCVQGSAWYSKVACHPIPCILATTCGVAM